MPDSSGLFYSGNKMSEGNDLPIVEVVSDYAKSIGLQDGDIVTIADNPTKYRAVIVEVYGGTATDGLSG